MKNKLFSKHAHKFLKKHPHESRFVTYGKAKSILLLFESDKNNDAVIQSIVSELKKDNKHVVAWGYSNTKAIVESANSEINLFNKKDITLFQKPKSKISDKVKSLKFDLAIDLSLNNIIPLLYLSLHSNASMKISSKKMEQQLFDFILDVNTQNEQNPTASKQINEQYLFHEIIFYLKNIETTD